MKRQLFKLSALVAAIFAMSFGQAHADIIFDFNEGTAFDGGQGIGAMMIGTEDDGSGTQATITIVDVFAPEFEFVDDGTGMGTGTFELTGNLLSASNGDGVTTQIGSNSLGVDNPSISDGDFFAGAGQENRDINNLEGFVISFDTAVTFTELDFASLDDGVFTISIGGADFDFMEDGTAGDIYANPFGALVIDAGTDLTFSFSEPGGDGNVRIPDFTVVAAVPEPSSMALICLLGLAGVVRRKK